MMSTAGSVSKGVFVFKGKKTVARADDYFQDGQASGLDMDRLDNCETLWECISEKIQVLQAELNARIFQDLVSYVQRVQVGFQLGRGGEKITKIIHEIPTAALVTGVNMPDHAVMFSNLTSQLSELVTSHIVTLKSKDCANIKTTMSNIVSQLMENVSLVPDDEEDEGEMLKMSRISSTMGVLASWYAHQTQRRRSSKKRKSNDGSAASCSQFPPIVIILEDLEAFPSALLQDLVTICSNHLHELPLVLIFGIATSVTAVHRLLPHTTSSLLSMEKFQAPPPSEYLNQIINEIVLTTNIPFKLGPSVFNLLLDLFLYHDFSVFNFIRGLQFSLLDHFYNHEISALCQPFDDAVKKLGRLSHHELERVRKLMSFRKHVESCEPQEQINLLTNDKHTKKCCGQWLADLDQFHENFYPVLRCLHAMTSRLPRYPLGKQLREMYCLILSKNICDTADYLEAITILRTLSRDELQEMLQQCHNHLSGEDVPEDLVPVQQQLQDFLIKLDDVEELGKLQGGEDEGEHVAEHLTPKKGMSLNMLRQKLQEMGRDKKKRLTMYEVLRNEAVDLVDELFRKYLLCPTSFPLHEIMYYNDSVIVRRHINGSPRATIQTALSTPYNYLQNDGCKAEGMGIPPTLPDLCIAYRLHVECGRLINLYDWLQAFIMIVQAEEESPAKDKKPDKVLQARFIRAVSELQFLGFIKSTKRKTDHVARLTWGGC